MLVAITSQCGAASGQRARAAEVRTSEQHDLAARAQPIGDPVGRRRGLGVDADPDDVGVGVEVHPRLRADGDPGLPAVRLRPNLQHVEDDGVCELGEVDPAVQVVQIDLHVPSEDRVARTRRRGSYADRGFPVKSRHADLWTIARGVRAGVGRLDRLPVRDDLRADASPLLRFHGAAIARRRARRLVRVGPGSAGRGGGLVDPGRAAME